jgi:hypothetical protein
MMNIGGNWGWSQKKKDTSRSLGLWLRMMGVSRCSTGNEDQQAKCRIRLEELERD